MHIVYLIDILDKRTLRVLSIGDRDICLSLRHNLGLGELMARAARKQKVARVHKALALYPHQRAAVDAYKLEKIIRFLLIWHRRAGKDVFGLDFARERSQERVGAYWHLFPFHVQARRAIWKGIDARTGERFIDRAFPESIRDHTNDSEMSISLKNGSTWQMLGSDNYDRLVGSNPAGALFSEWALCDPAAWDYIRPILVENKGWAMFITTFRARNHAYRMYQNLKDNPNWYVDLRTIRDTERNDGSPIVTEADVQKEIAEGMSASLAKQEFYCDPDAANTGTVFSRQYSRLLQIAPSNWNANNKVVRVAWGLKDEGIAAVVYQDDFVIGVSTFLERNITDAVQIVSQRYAQSPLVHCGVNLDPTLFSALDGQGVISVQEPSQHMQEGRTAALLNICRATSAAREVLADFCMTYTPYRESNDESQLAHPAISQALMVMQQAMPYKRRNAMPLNYSAYDRGVI